MASAVGAGARFGLSMRRRATRGMLRLGGTGGRGRELMGAYTRGAQTVGDLGSRSEIRGALMQRGRRRFIGGAAGVGFIGMSSGASGLSARSSGGATGAQY